MQIQESIIETFERRVARSPEREAVTCGDETLTFGALNVAANRLGWWLQAQGVGCGKRVIILSDNEPGRLVAALAILKTGGAFVQLPTTDPDSVLETLIRHAEPMLVLATDRHVARASRLGEGVCPVVSLGALNLTSERSNLGIRPEPNSLAYIQYTSGSTGDPKGVMVSHLSASFVALTCIRSNDLVEDDRVALFSLLWFSHIWASLSVGASLHIYDLGESGVAGIGEWIHRRAITIYSTFPTAFRHFVDMLEPRQKFPTVRIVSLTGESASRADIAACRQHFSERGVFINCYASTELVYVANTYVPWAEGVGDEPLSIGEPVEGVEVLLLDEEHREVGAGELGELAIKTKFLGSGYWRNPTLTSERFVRLPDGEERLFMTGDVGIKNKNGHIVLTGRKDQLIKIRGYRVVPNEVELALIAHPQVLNAGVTSFLNANADRRLVAFYLSQTIIASRTLTEYLSARLPPYMVPSLFVRLDSLPLTTSGKVDRRRLPKPESVDRETLPVYHAASTDTEFRLLSVWESLLGVAAIGVDDDFFELGGDSLQATRLLLEIDSKFSIEISPQTLLAKTGTIRSLAAEIDRQLAHRRLSSTKETYTPQGRPHLRASGSYVESTTGLTRFCPGAVTDGMQISSLGFRSEELLGESTESDVRIAFLGDSLTLDQRAGANENTWPHQVVEALRARLPAMSIDYLNAALPACHSRGLQLMYEQNVASLSPDVVVIQAADSFADCTFLARQQGIHDGVTHRRSRLAERYPFWHKLEMNMLIVLRLALAHRRAGKLRVDVDVLAERFEERLSHLAERCAQQARVLAFITICSRLRRGQSLLQRLRGAETSVYFAPFLHIASFVELQDAYNAAIVSTARKFDAVVVDVEALVPTGRRYFYDSMHLTSLGGRLLAQALTRSLCAHPKFITMTAQQVRQ